MVSDESNETARNLDKQAMVSQIIAFALVAGVSTFLGIALVIRSTGGKGVLAPDPWNIAPPSAIISLMSVVLAAIMIVLAFVVPNTIAVNMRRQVAKGKFPNVGPDSPPLKDAPSALRMIHQLRMIVGLAMLEGAAFLCVIAFLLEGRLPPLIAAGTLILLMVARIPTRERIDRFVEDQQAKILEDRQGA